MDIEDKFTQLPIQSQVRILIDAHNSNVGKIQSLEMVNASLLNENRRYQMRQAMPNDNELMKLKKICDNLNAKIKKQDEVIAKYRKTYRS